MVRVECFPASLTSWAWKSKAEPVRSYAHSTQSWHLEVSEVWSTGTTGTGQVSASYCLCPSSSHIGWNLHWPACSLAVFQRFLGLASMFYGLAAAAVIANRFPTTAFKQGYFIPLFATWRDISSCKICVLLWDTADQRAGLYLDLLIRIMAVGTWKGEKGEKSFLAQGSRLEGQLCYCCHSHLQPQAVFGR